MRAHSIARARRCMVIAARYGAGGRRRFFLAARPAGLARNFASWRKRRCTILAALAILARCRVSQPRANDCMCIAASTCSSSPVRSGRYMGDIGETWGDIGEMWGDIGEHLQLEAGARAHEAA